MFDIFVATLLLCSCSLNSLSKSFLIDSADESERLSVGLCGWSACLFCHTGRLVVQGWPCHHESTHTSHTHSGAEGLDEGLGWFVNTFNMFQIVFLSKFLTAESISPGTISDCGAFKLARRIYSSFALCSWERWVPNQNLTIGALWSEKKPQTLNWAEDSVMQIFCDAEVKL